MVVSSLEIPAIGILSSLILLSVLLLNFESSLLTLDINLIGSKLSPKFVEFSTIFVNVIVTVEHNDVFLVTLTSLKSPVK